MSKQTPHVPTPAVLQPAVPPELMQRVADAAAGRPLNVTPDELKQLSQAGNEYVMMQLGRQALLEQESIARHERLKAWNALSCRDRTQHIANDKWPERPGTQRYSVCIASPLAAEHPTITLFAHGEHEARALWMELCGVQRTEHDVVATLAPPDAPVPVVPDAPAPPAGPAPEAEAEVERARQLSETFTSAAAQGGKAERPRPGR
jgi:hypothetical protein